jgi:hypothetical protein
MLDYSWFHLYGRWPLNYGLTDREYLDLIALYRTERGQRKEIGLTEGVTKGVDKWIAQNAHSLKKR